MKKILLIHTGGTFGMVPMEPDQTLVPAAVQDHILTLVPELQRLAEIDVLTPFNKDSSNVGIEEWDLLSTLIYEHWSQYDGFVIIHGTDTMTYTASALSFSLRNVNKPVILTGSQRPLSQFRSDARLNLIDAVELSTLDLHEVLIVFNQKIFRGNRTKKVSIKSYDAFDSPNFPPIGEMGVTIEIDQSRLLRSAGELFHLPGFYAGVLVLAVQPSMSPEYFYTLFEQDVKALLLLGFGSGNLPFPNPNWLDFIKTSIKRGIPVFIGTQSIQGEVNLSLYEGGRQLLDAGAQSIGQMTVEAAYVKLLKILRLTSHPSAIVRMFNENWAGEF